MAEPLMCRICHDDDGEERLIHPCQCSGSMSHIHPSCLQHWILTRGEADNRDPMMCELCHTQYRVTWTTRTKCDTQHGDAPDDASDSDRVVIVVLFGVCVLTSLATLRRLYQRWKAAAQERILHPAPATVAAEAPPQVMQGTPGDAEVAAAAGGGGGGAELTEIVIEGADGATEGPQPGHGSNDYFESDAGVQAMARGRSSSSELDIAGFNRNRRSVAASLLRSQPVQI